MADALIGTLLSATLLVAILNLIALRRTTRITESVKADFARQQEVLSSQRGWREQSVAELLGPMSMQLDRTARAFRRWSGRNLYIESKVMRDANQTVRNLLLTKGHLIPPHLLDDAGRLVEHYDRWLEEFDAVRGGAEPRLEEPFVFAGPAGFPFPRDSERRFHDAFHSMWEELYG